MQRSSSSIASLAGALAKAQAVLANPEKSLVGTIPPDRPGGSERSFRYASLASGLEIVRKTLGEHEIATVQTTAIDQGAGTLNLTTVLAHSSGEWIASDWPVCPLAETATPHRMGAALTYARRYALFALVGIAGEDDLDAPDLAASSAPGSVPDKSDLGTGRLNGRRPHPSTEAGDQRKERPSPKSRLGPAPSAELRDRLVSQIGEIGSADDATLWAYCHMRAKNALTEADARHVEVAFQAKLASFPGPLEGLPLEGNGSLAEADSLILKPAEGEDEVTALNPCHAAAPTTVVDAIPPSPTVRARPPRGTRRTKSITAIDKTALAFPEPRRLRDREHVRFVARQPCLLCGRVPSDPHHLRFTQSRALGRKVSDEFTVPLCRGHHREVHRCGIESDWWRKVGIDPTDAARALWRLTHPLPSASTPSDQQESPYASGA